MANFEELKSQIRESIRENDNGEITGNIMQETLIRMVDDVNTSKQDAVAGKGLSTNDFTDAEKAKLGAVPNDVDSIIGLGTAIDYFSEEIPYQAGQFVLHYDSVSGKVKAYKFTDYHAAGAWTGSDVEIASIYSIFSAYEGTPTELLHIQLSSSDGLLNLSGRQVTINFADGGIESGTTDSNGYVEFSITKGRVYTVSVQQAGGEGYAYVPAQMSKAVSDDKYMYFEYSQIGGGYCLVKVYAYTYGQLPSNPAEFQGLQVQILLSDNTTQSAAFDANGIATFPSVPQNATGTIIFPKVAGYITPANITILTGFTQQDIQANYGSLSTPGIYFTLKDETDIDASALTSADIPNVIALHIATQDLIDAGADFYVRPADLWAATTKPNYKWCEPNANGQYPACPNVPVWRANTPYYDGQTASANMFSDLLAAGTYSKPLDYAMAETLVTDNRTAYGFLPTRDQFQVIKDNYDSVNGMLQMLDSSKSATYLARFWWMVNSSTTEGVFWYWSNGIWGSYYSYQAIASWFPFFSI